MGDGGAGKREAQRNREVLSEQKRQYEQAQNLLQKSKEEGISDLEAADARAQGIINSAQEQIINQLNQSSAGAIETLKQLDAKTQSDLQNAQSDILNDIISNSILTNNQLKEGFGLSAQELQRVQQETLKDLVDTGLLERQALTDQTLANIKSITGFSDKAIEALRPYQEQGERSLLQSRVLSGTATQKERADFEQKYGKIETSPLVQERIKQDEQAIARQQQALGTRFSGLGQQDILERGSRRIVEEELNKQLITSQNLAGLGLGAAQQVANINQQTGQFIGGLQGNLGQNLAQSYARQQQLGANVRTQLGTQQANLPILLSQLLAANLQRQQELQSQFQQNFTMAGIQQGINTGQNIANIQLGMGQQQSNVLQNLSQIRANLASQLGAASANTRLGQSTNIANLIAQSANQQAAGLMQANALQSQSETSFLSDVSGLLKTGLNVAGQVIGSSLGGPAGTAAAAAI